MGYACSEGSCWKHNHDPKTEYYFIVSNGSQHAMINETPITDEKLMYAEYKKLRHELPPHVCIYIEQRKTWVRHPFNTDPVDFARKVHQKRYDDKKLDEALAKARQSVTKAIKKARTHIKDLRNNVKNLEEKKSKRGFRKKPPKNKRKGRKSKSRKAA